jgi:hypothetical protein
VYGFADGDPVNFSDPYGLTSLAIVNAAVAKARPAWKRALDAAVAYLGGEGGVAIGLAMMEFGNGGSTVAPAAQATGTIYRVPGSATQSGRPYIGRHNRPNPAVTRRSTDGRDRTKAEVVDTYDADDVQEGREKEQAQIDAHGLQNTDNKRNEIRKKKPDGP